MILNIKSQIKILNILKVPQVEKYQMFGLEIKNNQLLS